MSERCRRRRDADASAHSHQRAQEAAMSRIRFALLLAAVAMTALAPSAVFAADPTAEVAPGPATGHDTYRPLSSAEQRALAARERQAARVAAGFGSSTSATAGGSLCPTSPVRVVGGTSARRLHAGLAARPVTIAAPSGSGS